jgi:dihydroxyacetone kinase-like protein
VRHAGADGEVAKALATEGTENTEEGHGGTEGNGARIVFVSSVLCVLCDVWGKEVPARAAAPGPPAVATGILSEEHRAMAGTADFGGVVAMLKGMAAKLAENIDLLTKLDSATGDGDHGAAIQRVVSAIESTIGKDTKGEIKSLLNDVGWAVMAVPGGSTGPLFGSLIVGMSEGAPDGEGEDAALDCSGVATVLEAGQAKLRKQTRAVEGEKTLVDALFPAVRAVREAAEAGKGLREALEAGAAAAAAGAEATKAMKAKHGRARNLGDRVIGHADPGATSISFVFAGLAEGAPAAE